jgi:hypothetical protein
MYEVCKGEALACREINAFLVITNAFNKLLLFILDVRGV